MKILFLIYNKMDLPFHLFLGDKELLNNSEISIAEAAHNYRLDIDSSLDPKPTTITLLLTNVTTNTAYYLDDLDLVNGKYKSVYDYDYGKYPIEPGVYVFYIFLRLEDFPDVKVELKVRGFRENYKLPDFGELLHKIKFYVKAKSSLIPNINMLPMDIQKYLVENNFTIYEILDFCFSDSPQNRKVCDNPGFWKLLATNRLTRSFMYDTSKDHVIHDLRKTENFLNYTITVKKNLVDALIDFADFEIVLLQARLKWNNHRLDVDILNGIDAFYDYRQDETQEYINKFFKVINTLFPGINVDKDISLINLIDKILLELTDFEFETFYNDLIKYKYSRDIFRLFLKHIKEEEWSAEIAKYNLNNNNPFVL
jgi:hypothetical protein